MKYFYFNVMTIRSYIARNIEIVAIDENMARKEVWSWLIQRDLLDRDLFYKVELIDEQEEEL